MRRIRLLVVASLAVAALAWLSITGGGPFASTEGVPAAGVEDSPDAAAAANGEESVAETAVLRARAGRPDADAFADEAKGNASIVGLVLRDGKPAAAKVEARVWKGRRAVIGPWGASAQLRDTVDFETWAPRVVRKTKSGADGRFAFDALAHGFYEIAATAEDGAENGTDVRVQADLRQEVRIVLPIVAGTAALKGRVVRADGTPWRGSVGLAPVGRNAFDDDAGTRWRRIVETDAEGRFAAAGLRPGWVEAHAFDGERHVGAGPIRVPREDEWLWNLDAGLADVSGRVVADADGSAIVGASVIGGGYGHPGEGLREGYARTTTGPDGSFTLRVRPRDARVVAEATGYAAGIAYVDEGVKAELRLQRVARIEGRVTVEPGGGPAAGAVVHVVTTDPDGRDTASAVATAGPDGRFAFEGLSPRDAALSVRGGGWLSKGAEKRGFAAARVTLTPGVSSTVDLVVVKGARAEGIVVDAAGTPVAGARIRVEETAQSEDNLLDQSMNGRRWDRWATGADGRFVVDDLLPNTQVRFRASAPGEADVVSDQLKASFDAPLDVRLQFPAARWLLVTVVDEGGKPLPRAWANAQWQSPVKGASGGTATGAPSGTDGLVRVGPIPGGARLEVQPSAGTRDHRLSTAIPKITFESGQTEATLTVTVAQGHSIEGRVTWPDGAKAVEVPVEANGPGGGGHEMAWPPDGAFKFRGLGAGKYQISVRWTRGDVAWKGSIQADTGAKDVVVALTADEPSFLVRVTGPDGRPVPQAQVRLFARDRKGGTRDDHQQATDGIARWDDDAWPSPEQEEVKVSVWDAKRRDGSPLPFGPAHVVVASGQREVSVALPGELSIAGRVVDPEGKGVAGVWVHAQPVVERGEDQRTGGSAARSGADGAFRIGGLAQGRHTLSATPGNAWLATTGAPCATGDADVRLVVRPALEVRVSIVDDGERPVVGARVNVQGQQASANAQTDEAGVAVLSRLAPGDVTNLQVNPPNERRDLTPYRRERWVPRDEYVRLERALAVAGWVRDPAGRGVPGAYVQVGNSGTSSGEDGTFAVERVPAGDLAIRVRFPADEGTRFEGVVTAGRRDVVVTIDPGCVLEVTVDGLPAGTFLQTAILLRRGAAPRAIQGFLRGTAVRFSGLDPDVDYALYACNRPQDHAVFVEGLRCGDAVRVRAVPAPPISVAVRIPARAWCNSVSVDLGGWAAGGRRLEEGARWEIRGLPDGSWAVRAHGQTDDGRALQGSALARRGSAEIDLAELR